MLRQLQQKRTRIVINYDSFLSHSGIDMVLEQNTRISFDRKPTIMDSPGTLNALAKAAEQGDAELVRELLDECDQGLIGNASLRRLIVKVLEKQNSQSSNGLQKYSIHSASTSVIIAGADSVNEYENLCKSRGSDCSTTATDEVSEGSPIPIEDITLRKSETRATRRRTRTLSAEFAETSHLVPLLTAAANGDADRIRHLLQRPDTSITCREPVNGRTALHLAVRGGHVDVIRVLCESNVIRSIIDIQDYHRNTALHLAVGRSSEITKILLKSGARVDTMNLRNQTPLGALVYTMVEGHQSYQMIKLLLEYGADPSAHVDKSSILHVAIDRHLSKVADLLVQSGCDVTSRDGKQATVFDKLPEDQLTALLVNISRRPRLVSKEQSNRCMGCSKKFVFHRARNCTHCGRILCTKCSSCSITIDSLPDSFRTNLGAGAPGSIKACKPCATARCS